MQQFSKKTMYKYLSVSIHEPPECRKKGHRRKGHGKMGTGKKGTSEKLGKKGTLQKKTDIM